ncbi:MAG: hypothetical protein AAGK97_18515, partial [Bacteroidota bacterium]
PNSLYIHITDVIGRSIGFYKSTDGGENWERRSDNIDNITYHWWFSKLFIHPTEANTIYYCGFHMWKSTNGGITWEQVFSGAHVDHHALVIHPSDPDLVFNGNDGGLYLSRDGGSNHTEISNFSNFQFYTCTLDPNNQDVVYGGTQDNGTWRNTTDLSTNWEFIWGGDGFNVLVEPGNSNVYYVSSQNGSVHRTDNNGSVFTSVGRSITENKNWKTPFAIDPFEPNIFYFGAESVWKSTNKGDSFTSSSPILHNDNSNSERFGTVTTINVSEVNPNFVYAGTDDGNVWLSQDKGNNWANINPPMNMPRWTTSLATNRFEENVAYVTFSGFRFNSNDGH